MNFYRQLANRDRIGVELVTVDLNKLKFILDIDIDDLLKNCSNTHLNL